MLLVPNNKCLNIMESNKTSLLMTKVHFWFLKFETVYISKFSKNAMECRNFIVVGKNMDD